jgi:hypothetical protein
MTGGELKKEKNPKDGTIKKAKLFETYSKKVTRVVDGSIVGMKQRDATSKYPLTNEDGV